ncbi:MAG: type II toxin-antitoxin system Phd/YefM family antitoxin [Candidatus Cloacimonetes bacterium]|nr:type II toxin-antitoxin system Phd/YefM family antitoxin [Candidatus Cloacimonadota bacterium]
MKTYNIKFAKKRFEELIDETINHDKVVKITGNTANAILISESKWNSIKETLFLLSITGMKESIKNSMNTSLDECSGEVEWV